MGSQLSKCLDCVSPQQQVLDAGQYMNPVIDSDFPDPFVLKYKDHWLAYGTNASGGNVQASFTRSQPGFSRCHLSGSWTPAVS